jgi:hypothetical protein
LFGWFRGYGVTATGEFFEQLGFMSSTKSGASQKAEEDWAAADPLARKCDR